MRRALRALLIMVGASALSGCVAIMPMARCQDMQLDNRLGNITEIRLHDNIGDQREANPYDVIHDLQQIDHIRQFALARKDHWYAPLEGVPVGRVRAVFWEGEERRYALSLGPHFLEAQGCNYFFIRNLSEADTVEFARLIGWTSPLRP